jgi:hypothetical protein
VVGWAGGLSAITAARVQPGGWLTAAGLVGAAVILGVATAVQPVLTLVGATLLLVGAWTSVRPVRGAYLLVLAVPLVVGIGRGLAVPVLRPNELLITLLLGLVVLRGTFSPRAGEVRLGPITAIDRAFGLLFLFGSLVPLAVMLFRSDLPSIEDTFQLLSLVKYYLVYRLILATVQTEAQMLTVARLMLAASILVAVVGLLQSARLFGIHEWLATYYSAGQVREALEFRRATSTLGVWQALGAYLAIHATLAAALLTTDGRSRWRGLLIAALVVDVLGALATATLTAVVALAVGLGLVAFLGRRVRHTSLWTVPLLIVALLVFWPAVEERWNYQFESWGASGTVPVTWEYRLHNLTHVFWPVVQDNLVFGVAPSVSPDLIWRFPENQVMYLLYQGGLLYVGAYVVFMAVVLRSTWRFQRALGGPARAIARTAFIAWLLILVLGLFDPHLTMAGEADAAWALLALSTGAAIGRDGGQE